METCVFCRIAKGELPASKVFEDDSTLAFMDLQSGAGRNGGVFATLGLRLSAAAPDAP